MRLSWNEIRARAAAFAREWAGEGYEKGQTQLFYRDFFEVFGVPVRRVATFEERVEGLGERRGFIDMFWPGLLLVEQKSVGRSLTKAKVQALDYFPGLTDTQLPRYLLLSDFQTFELYDLDEGQEFTCTLKELPQNIEKFGFILGVERRPFKDQDPVNIAAAELVGKVHDALRAAGHPAHDLERFLVRIVFCLFADDTGIFEPRDIFFDLIIERTRDDGSDMGGWLSQLFQVLNTPEDRRPRNLDSDLARFPYVNGDIFLGPLSIPSFDTEMRRLIVEACEFDWSGISPAIFGSLFQSVMDDEERRAQGAHYTTERNILKVIEPLFLDDLRADFARLRALKGRSRRVDLRTFHRRLSAMRFLDPACGCGNFLIIAYRELRTLEIEVIRELRQYQASQSQGELDAAALSLIDVDQFYGIELGEFPARIAETAMWMMDHIMNNRLSLEFGQTYVRIPLGKSPHIVHADALESDWASILPPKDCSYVLGNPPFVGSKYQSDTQREQVQRVVRPESGRGTLDYVSAWFVKAGEYALNSATQIGFVATNSITQGEQIAQLWPLLFDRYSLEISFAHRTFAWGSDARGRAHVHVVILGLVSNRDAPKVKRLFSYDEYSGEPHESRHTAISPYLFDAQRLRNAHIVVREAASPSDTRPRLIIGSKPIDGGHYIFTDEERALFLAKEPAANDYLRPYVGSREFLHGDSRWILALHEVSPGMLATLPEVRQKIAAVRDYRLDSRSESTRELARRPREYHVNVLPKTPFLVIPGVSSERREYVPIGWMTPPTIPSNLVFVLDDATLALFGLLTSSVHMSWLRYIGGRLKSDYRYSIGLVYNTFPFPQISKKQTAALEILAQAILDARQSHSGETLANLYDPELMPADLLRAHRALDRGVDKLYRRTPFRSDMERVEHLLRLYEDLLTV